MKSTTEKLVAGVVIMLAAGCTNSEQPGATTDPQGQIGAVRPTSNLAPVGELPLAPAPNKELYAKSFINRSAPDLIVDTWITPQPSTQGKMILIDFWATWCGPCCKAIPELNALHRRFADRLVVIGLSEETAEQVEAMSQPRIEYYEAVDPQQRTKSAFGVKGIPHVVIIDPTGVVRWEGFPFMPGHELTEEVVAKLLDTYVR
jgi:cytochrome c biogenesis protein CcmG/thiol:disulfide interchange protein DsbE